MHSDTAASDLAANGARLSGIIGHDITVNDTTEQEIDLLLVEELYSSESFRRHFLQMLGNAAPETAHVVGVHHSVRRPMGQSDLELELDVAGANWLVMVENKIAAVFQPQQAERYVQGGQYRTSSYAKFITVLVAPGAYLGGQTYGFDVAIAYEDLLAWFKKAEELGERRQYKVGLWEAAIAKCEDDGDGPAAKDPRSTAFFHEYWKLAQDLAPELRMKDEPKSGGFLYFYPANLPKYLKLMHRVRKGYVDLQFCGMAEQVDDLHQAFSKVLPPDFEVRRVTGSAAIGTVVPTLVREGEFGLQRDKVETAIAATKRLWAWFLANRDIWEQRRRLEKTAAAE